MLKFLREKLSFFKKKVVKDFDTSIYSDSMIAYKLKEEKIDDLLWDLEVALMEADVALPVIEAIKSNVKSELAGRSIKRGIDAGSLIEATLKRSIKSVLTTNTIDFDGFIAQSDKPVIIMFVGINGTGKTLAVAKIAHRLLQKKYSCVLAAADTFRAGAIEQLEKHAANLNVKLIKHQPGSDPAAVAYDAIAHAKARGKKVVLIDTAGRMQTDKNLMAEMKKIKRVAQPHLTIFVGDAIAGNDAVQQAETFDNEVGIDATILTKIDVDAKGGAAISVAHTTGKPIIFVGTGQGYADLVEFNPTWLIDRLFEGS
jgi:fused signal recognition particle receptor